MERLHFYLGTTLCNRQFKHDYEVYKNNSTDTFYDIDLKKLLTRTGHSKKPYSFAAGDIQHHTHPCALVKNRCGNGENGVILRCLSFKRHWHDFYNRPTDIPFQSKRNTVFWRGATTGAENRVANRFQFVKRWFNVYPSIDVGFSFVCQDMNSYKAYVKGESSIQNFLQYKYIVSIEGNDKDSGLNWKLNSNSLVLMAKPRVCSWLMETTLLPEYHYVLLKDDFSDLADKLAWCNANQQACKTIIENAHVFMSKFADTKAEEDLEKQVIDRYFELIAEEKNSPL